jgi:hypothetical protein
MSNKFITALDHVGDAIKDLFTNKTAVAIEDGALDIAEVAFPAASTLIQGISKSLATAQALAAAANVSGSTAAQVTALTLADAQTAFSAYETATGSTVETPQQKAIVAAIVNLFQQLPAAASTVAPATAGAEGAGPASGLAATSTTAAEPVAPPAAVPAAAAAVSASNENLL